MATRSRVRRTDSCTDRAPADGLRETRRLRGWARLVTLLLVDDAQQRLAGDETADVLAEQPQLPIAGPGRLTPLVRRQRDVVELPQHVLRRERLRIGDVEAGPRDLAVLES